MLSIRQFVFLLVLSFIPILGFSKQTQTLSCYVISVSDGDTLTCSLKNRQKIRVRLLDIDAPEKDQPFGIESKDMLTQLVHKREVRLTIYGKDYYQRTLAVVYDKRNREINLLMVKRGMAWSYKRHSQKSPYLRAEKQAQKKQLGLWKDPHPILPAEWRARQRQGIH